MIEKETIREKLMGVRNINNASIVNNLLGRLDLLTEEEIQEKLLENGITDEAGLTKLLEVTIDNMLEEYVRSEEYAPYQNAEKDNRESRTFSEIRSAYEKMQNILREYELTSYLSGGTVPYFLLNADSNRLHDDIDTICKLEDIDKIREAFQNAGLYISEWDSKNFAKDGKDYGFEIMIDGVPVGFYPFSYSDGRLTQYTYDQYNQHCKIQEAELHDIGDYVQSYKSRDGQEYTTMSLEYIKKSKDAVKGRPKDEVDSRAIVATRLLRPDVLERINLPILVADQYVGPEIEHDTDSPKY